MWWRRYRAFDHKGKMWTQTNGVPESSLANRCAHSRRWPAKLDGVLDAPKSKPIGFLAARVRSLPQHQPPLCQAPPGAQSPLSARVG